MLNHSFAALVSFTLIFCIIFLVTRKKAGALHYDEMQLQIRGDAYKLGFSAVIVLLAVTGLLYDADGLNISNYMTTDMLLFVILYAGVTVFAVYSILNNAFFRVLENGNRYLLLCVFLIVSNGASLFQSIRSGRFLEHGVLDFGAGGANLLCVICFLLISGAIVIRKAGRNEEEDEES